jgi:hypothetical protein
VVALGEVALAPAWRVALACLLALLGAALVVALVALRRRRVAELEAQVPARRLATPPPLPLALPTRVAAAESRPRGAALAGGGGGLALAEPAARPATHGGRMGCPSCRREYDVGVRFCTADARRLVPLAEVAARGRAAGSVCPRCRRAYDPGIRYCPHDSEELLPAPLWEATHGRRGRLEPTGVIAKICPHCAVRYDLAAGFCSRDGAELMIIN